MTKKKEQKDLVVKEENAVANPLAGMFDTGLASSGDTLDKEDLRISKFTLIQQMTKSSFNTENAPNGNYVDSIEKTDLGSEIDVFIMNDTKLWEIKYLPNGKSQPEYLTTIDHTTENKDLRNNPRILPEFAKIAEDKGVTVDMIANGQLNAIHRFYVLKVEDVIAGNAFPYIVDFKRASYGAGVQLKNNFYKMRNMQKLPSYAKVFTIGSLFVQDDYEYFIKTVSAGRMILPEEIKAVEKWVRELQENKDAYAEDNSDEEDYVETTATRLDEPLPEGIPEF